MTKKERKKPEGPGVESTPELEERLLKVVEDCPLSDEPLTPEQVERVQRNIQRIHEKYAGLTDDELIALIKRGKPN